MLQYDLASFDLLDESSLFTVDDAEAGHLDWQYDLLPHPKNISTVSQNPIIWFIEIL